MTCKLTSEPKRRKSHYDEDLLVRLVAEGRMSYRKIAQQLGISPNTVSTAARGVFRRDLYERICTAIADTCHGTRNPATGCRCPILAALVKNGLLGDSVTR